ncbi:hypothetical protein [Streptomyces capitiformicae]|uniref:AAA domain-containing protein n=1 Tax=Streptomyces capitiformicae TaxID=2014920 RepID=A0A918ZRI6_9ACTN|nr:hypothetical protein [Streptomyces capitiformicae]GHE64822.1 hypothetical protein GCM10017771_88470 [Streptomyces capitiformicae]
MTASLYPGRPENALLVLIGASGAGKSTLASTWPEHQVVSLDRLRGVMADDFSVKSSVLSSIASAAAAPGALAARVNISLLMRSAGARRADTDRAATKGRGAGWTGRCGQAWPRAC